MIKSLGEKHPDTKKASFIAPDSAILGDVTLAEGTSVWYGAVIRGDLDHITIGKNSNVQDNCTLHGDRGYPITLGEGVSIGHNAVVHGATVGEIPSSAWARSCSMAASSAKTALSGQGPSSPAALISRMAPSL